jgi:hypothetical protein
MLIVSNRRATSAHSTTINSKEAIPNTGADRDSRTALRSLGRVRRAAGYSAANNVFRT